MRIVLATALLALAGCAGGSPPRRGPERHDVEARPVALGVDAGSSSALPTLEELAQRGASELPLMRERVRSADVIAPIELKSDADACLRAIVAAEPSVAAWFEDGAHERRGATFSGASGLVPPSGPACFRRGEASRLVVTKANASGAARAIVWQSP
jgi:hypothetical protein